jgi:AraC-like DNA-binding protein
MFRRKPKTPAQIILNDDEVGLMRFFRDSRGILEWSNELTGDEMALLRRYRAREAARAVEEGRKAAEDAKQYELMRRFRPRVVDPEPPDMPGQPEELPDERIALRRALDLKKQNPKHSWTDVASEVGYSDRYLRELRQRWPAG